MTDPAPLDLERLRAIIVERGSPNDGIVYAHGASFRYGDLLALLDRLQSAERALEPFLVNTRYPGDKLVSMMIAPRNLHAVADHFSAYGRKDG